jgi:hypothetical protein
LIYHFALATLYGALHKEGAFQASSPIKLFRVGPSWIGPFFVLDRLRGCNPPRAFLSSSSC